MHKVVRKCRLVREWYELLCFMVGGGVRVAVLLVRSFRIISLLVLTMTQVRGNLIVSFAVYSLLGDGIAIFEFELIFPRKRSWSRSTHICGLGGNQLCFRSRQHRASSLILGLEVYIRVGELLEVWS